MIKPPVAERGAFVSVCQGDPRKDPYNWLRNRDDPKVIEYLEAENQYADQALAHTKELQQEIFDELKSRVVETDTSAPVKDGIYEYYYKDRKSDSYVAHYRKKVGLSETEELLIDENQLAEGQSFFDLDNFEISPDDQILAYATDTTGNERYTIRFLKLCDRQHLPEEITNASSAIVWSSSGTHLYYCTLNDVNRPYRLYRQSHR